MKKLFSLLLAVILVAGMLTTFTSANTLPNLGMNDTITGMPSNAENVQYLSDLYGTHVVDQVNKTVALDKGYHDYLYVFTSGSRWAIRGSKIDANGNRTLENGTTYNKNEIALGYNGTKFEKGLGVHPDAPGKADRYIVYDVSKLNVNRFYAVVGGTGEMITDPKSKDYYLEFELLGSKSATYDANSFESLAIASNVRSYLVAEFDVDITGYNFIKLAIRATGSSNTSCGGAWGGACVYTGTEPAGPSFGEAAQPDAFTVSADGTYAGIPSEHLANSAYLSDLPMGESSNTNGNTSSVNHPYGDPDSVINLGDLSNMFWDGIGMHPGKPSDADSYTIYDVSEYACDRFYSVVGITNANGKNGAGSGVIFGVFGDYGDGNYVLLAQSPVITKTAIGEFDVDITGVKNLKLAVICGGNTNASSACAWAKASLYSTTGTPNLPTEPTEPETEPTVKPTTKPTTKPSTTKPTEAPAANDSAEFPIGIVIGIAAVVVVAVVAVVVVIIIKKKKAN